jgi:hypothetical protein
MFFHTFLCYLGHYLQPRHKGCKMNINSHDLLTEISIDNYSFNFEMKRSFMAKKFYPEKGGDKRVMPLINEGYELLNSNREKSL